MLFQQVKYCGNTLPHRFLSVEGAVQIKFKSDGNGNGQGFKLEYSLPSKIFLIIYYFRILNYEFIIIFEIYFKMGGQMSVMKVLPVCSTFEVESFLMNHI